MSKMTTVLSSKILTGWLPGNARSNRATLVFGTPLAVVEAPIHIIRIRQS
jgi:hypothetical protein